MTLFLTSVLILKNEEIMSIYILEWRVATATPEAGLYRQGIS
jgi:hypothetical protein